MRGKPSPAGQRDTFPANTQCTSQEDHHEHATAALQPYPQGVLNGHAGGGRSARLHSGADPG